MSYLFVGMIGMSFNTLLLMNIPHTSYIKYLNSRINVYTQFDHVLGHFVNYFSVHRFLRILTPKYIISTALMREMVPPIADRWSTNLAAQS